MISLVFWMVISQLISTLMSRIIRTVISMLISRVIWSIISRPICTVTFRLNFALIYEAIGTVIAMAFWVVMCGGLGKRIIKAADRANQSSPSKLA